MPSTLVVDRQVRGNPLYVEAPVFWIAINYGYEFRAYPNLRMAKTRLKQDMNQYRQTKDKPWYNSEPPAVFLLDAESGRYLQVGEYDMPKYKVALSHCYTAEQVYILCPRAVMPAGVVD